MLENVLGSFGGKVKRGLLGLFAASALCSPALSEAQSEVTLEWRGCPISGQPANFIIKGYKVYANRLGRGVSTYPVSTNACLNNECTKTISGIDPNSPYVFKVRGVYALASDSTNNFETADSNSVSYSPSGFNPSDTNPPSITITNTEFPTITLNDGIIVFSGGENVCIRGKVHDPSYVSSMTFTNETRNAGVTFPFEGGDFETFIFMPYIVPYPMLSLQTNWFFLTAKDFKDNTAAKRIAIVSIPSGLDSDGDGVSDLEEMLVYGTNRNSDDSDGDGVPDGYEINRKYNPLNTADGFKNKVTLNREGFLHISAYLITGQTFYFQGNTNLSKTINQPGGISPDNWTTIVTTNVSQEGQAEFVVPVNEAAQYFFRILPEFDFLEYQRKRNGGT